ncbi:hypothetical protein M8C21_002421, partial [Ambrosia artemisiifolia]
AYVAAITFIFLNLIGHCYGDLQFGFYNGKCGTSDIEDIVRRTVVAKFFADKTIAPALIRMQFHDCFVNGCDASILLDGTNSEKTAPPNLSVRGYDVIDAAKVAVERVCPGVVSCADVIVMATRDVISLVNNTKCNGSYQNFIIIFNSGGGRYNVQTGRRDGTTSLAQNTASLPSPSTSVSSAIQAFASKGLTATDMIYLLGGHTIGATHCSFIKDRIYNFKNTGKPDPNMDWALLSSLRRTCPQNATVDRAANLDQNPFSSSVVDKSFYNQIMLHRGVLQIDQELAIDSLSKSTVATIASSSDFTTKFGQAMVKLGAIQVLTGTQGEIRIGFVIVLNLTSHCYGALEFGFYNGKCKFSDVEDIVRRTVYSKFLRDRTIAPALIRMQFHDCFVNSGGRRYSVQTGRRDGRVSLARNTQTLPPPSASVSSAIRAFARKGLNPTDMLYLLGGHTIGIAHCSLFQDRLYNFQNSGKPDPTMDVTLLASLRKTCAQNATVDRTVNLDQNPLSSKVIDKSFYTQIMSRRGVLQIDQQLALDGLTKSKVAAIAASSDFNTKFGQAMVKMGAIQVLTGTQGEIRSSCR